MINAIKTTSLSNINNANPSFKGFYNNKILLSGLKFASDNSALFSAGTALALSVAVKPIAILSTPKTDKKNKQIACAKSIASSAAGFLIMLAATSPIAKAVKNIDHKPEHFLKKSTIKLLQDTASKLTDSKKYMFATQIFKLGIGLLVAYPKSALTCALIPPIFKKMFPDKEPVETKPMLIKTKRQNNPSFKGLYDTAVKKLAKGIGKTIDSNIILKTANRFYETNFAQHIMNLTDILLTYSFITQTKRNKDIEQNRKKALIHNSIISTGLSIVGGYAVNKALNKPTERFIKKFKDVNKNLPNLEKYEEGIRIAKPVFILGGIYYILIPIISTFCADRTSETKRLQK